MGGSAPKADPQIGEAAKMSAQTGQEMLAWMQGQAETTNQWAAEDRDRYQTVFEPLQDQYIADAQSWDSPERQASEAAKAGADVSLAAQQGVQQRSRSAMSMGVNPLSGRFASAEAKAGTDTALAKAGAENLARQSVQQQGQSMKANAINLGQGLGVNPATSMGLSNGASSSGFSGAMSGYGQQGSLLNTQYQQQMQSWQANQGALGSVGGAIGSVMGMLSTKKAKENRKPVDALGALRKMPVEQWDYKKGAGDEGTHIGPYAEDFAKATGIGDGNSIDVISAIGLSLGAVRQLADKVDKIAEQFSGGRGAAANAA